MGRLPRFQRPHQIRKIQHRLERDGSTRLRLPLLVTLTGAAASSRRICCCLRAWAIRALNQA
jgi:hypothetical protein